MDLRWIFYFTCFIWVLSFSCIVFASNFHPAFTEKKVSEIVTQVTSDCDPSVCHNTNVVELITHVDEFDSSHRQ